MRRATWLGFLLVVALLLPAATAQAHHPLTLDPWRSAIFGPGTQRMLMPIGGLGARARQGADGPSTPGAYGDCGPGAAPETGLQGQVPPGDQASGRSKQGYRCNMRLVGANDIGRRGANFQLAWHRDCGYVGIVGNQPGQVPGRPTEATNGTPEGVAVVDARDPRAPRHVRTLKSPVGRTQHEGIEVNEKRGMLVVTIGGLSAQWIEIYDISRDCANPVFKGRYDAGRAVYHGLDVSDDGRTVYATDTFNSSGAGQILDAIDVTDMSQPRLLAQFSARYGIHDLELSPDGRRAYLGASPTTSSLGTIVAGGPSNYDGPSVVVLDTTEVHQRRPSPAFRVVSQTALTNFGHTEQRARINGRPYLISSGEAPVTGSDNCPWAWGHILDMSDETAPREVAELKLDVNQRSLCSRIAADDEVYSIHYIGVDDEENTTKVFYTYYTGGLRVFDVRDPTKPREIAYYHPPPKPSTTLKPASQYSGDNQTPEWDSMTSNVRYRPETGHIWAVGIANGFQVLELTGAARRVGPAPRGTGARRCLSRRRFTAHVKRRLLRRGERVRRVRVTVNGRRLRARRTGRRGVVLDLRRRRAGVQRVRIVVRTSKGRTVVDRRTYRTCASRRRAASSGHRRGSA